MSYDEPDFLDPDEAPDDKQLNQDIDDALARARPERYDAADKDWMAPVVESARSALAQRPADELARDAAARRVYRREAEATKRTNRILRDIAQTGQPPLGGMEAPLWREMLFDILRSPLSIDGKRVRLGIAGAADLQQWELQNYREQEARNLAQEQSRSGARLLAEWVTGQGVDHVEDLYGMDPDPDES